MGGWGSTANFGEGYHRPPGGLIWHFSLQSAGEEKHGQPARYCFRDCTVVGNVVCVQPKGGGKHGGI